ncbi:hypothetical protein LCGC14_1982480, partial [marine sediment metagenome]
GFDIILLDVCMPEMDGFEVAEHIRQAPQKEGAEPVVMMLTSSAYGEQAARCGRLGVAACMPKPVRQVELLDGILVALGKAGPARPAEKHGAPAPAAPRPLRILLAEDSPISRDVATEMLQSMGHTVVPANDGRQAVEAAAKECFDLIFMDVQMPEMSGLEATAEIRALQAGTGRRTPIVALTAHAMKSDQQRCIDAGMDDYLSKPITGDRIAEVIARVLAEAPEDAADPPDRPSRPAPEIIDLAALLHRCMGNAEAMNRILKHFGSSARGIPDRIEQAIARGDMAEVVHLAHSLKGDAASLSAEGLRAASEAVEKLGRVGAEAAARTRLLELRAELALCLEYIPEALANTHQTT